MLCVQCTLYSKEEQSDLSVTQANKCQPTKVSNWSQINSIKCYIKCKPIEQGEKKNDSWRRLI